MTCNHLLPILQKRHQWVDLSEPKQEWTRITTQNNSVHSYLFGKKIGILRNSDTCEKWKYGRICFMTVGFRFGFIRRLFLLISLRMKSSSRLDLNSVLNTFTLSHGDEQNKITVLQPNLSDDLRTVWILYPQFFFIFHEEIFRRIIDSVSSNRNKETLHIENASGDCDYLI